MNERTSNQYLSLYKEIIELDQLHLVSLFVNKLDDEQFYEFYMNDELDEINNNVILSIFWLRCNKIIENQKQRIIKLSKKLKK